MIWSRQPVHVRAPATSANLGPGFDALGLALGLHDKVEVRITGGGLAVEVSGEGADTAGDGERHLVVRALRAAFAQMGGQPPGLSLRCENTIPHGRGLGSSAAAIVSGILAARALVGGGESLLPGDAVFPLAAGLEGHADNVAACLAGGLTLAWGPAPAVPGRPDKEPALPGQREDGPWRPRAATRLIRIPVIAGLAAVVCVPPARLATATARRVLPAAIPHADAAANAARSALLVLALTSEPGALFDATEDFLHQPYRAAVMADSADLVARLRRSGVAAVISGAGPSVLALTIAGREPGPEVVDSIAGETGIAWRVIPLDVDRHGAIVRVGGPDVHPPDSTRQGSPWNQAQGLHAGHEGRSP